MWKGAEDTYMLGNSLCPMLKDLPDAYWDKIIDAVHAYIKQDASHACASSAATAVEENAPKADDPYANFKMVIN